jgi:arylsulfatase A-like enzyme
MRIIAAIILAICILAASSLLAQPTTSPAKPNIVIILADDLGYADIGGQASATDVVTPNIDSIAKNGVRFTNGYVSCPVCSPSRAGLLTGRYQQRFGYEGNPIASFDDRFGLPHDQVTLADVLKKAGYVTAAFGKWHEGNIPEYRPLLRGFDEFFGFLGGLHGYMGKMPLAEQGWNCIRRGDEPVEEKEYLTDALSREAVSFIDRHQARPFFMYVAYNAVHSPLQSPPKYLDRFKEVKDRSRQLMLAMLSAEDDGVGRILTKLRDCGLEEKTLVIFLSDNGGPTSENASRNAPLRGFKGQVWEGGIRVPFMMQWKGRIAPGRVLDQPVISLDLFPTALAIAGADGPKNVRLDGVNLLPLVEGKTNARPHETLYWRFLPQWAIRDGDYKLEKSRDGVTRLYDLSNDLREQNNLMSSAPEVAKRLQAKFDAWNAELKDPLWPGRQEGEHDAAMIDQLEATAEAE